MRYAVYLEPYSLEHGEVGKDIYKPVLISWHRSKLAAARKLVRQITGTDSEAREYLRQVNGKPYAIALRYLIWVIEPSGRISRKMSVKQAREAS